MLIKYFLMRVDEKVCKVVERESDEVVFELPLKTLKSLAEEFPKKQDLEEILFLIWILSEKINSEMTFNLEKVNTLLEKGISLSMVLFVFDHIDEKALKDIFSSESRIYELFCFEATKVFSEFLEEEKKVCKKNNI